MSERRPSDIGNVAATSADGIKRAKRYNRTRLAVLCLSTVWTVARLAWFADDRRAARLKRFVEASAPDRRVVAPSFFGIAALLFWLSSLPLDFLGGYLVERRYGLTKQSPRGWLSDRLKALLVGLVTQIPILTAAFAVIRRRPRDWWWMLASASVPVSILLSNLAPIVLMPLFNRLVPLRDEGLRQRVHGLATRSGVIVSELYEMDMSRQSEKPNAMFAGLGNTKRIVLSDTLLDRFPDAEIEAVVAHELGHQVNGDVWRLIGFGAAAGFGSAWLLSHLAPAAVRRTADRTGVSQLGDEASLPTLTMVMGAIGSVLMPIQSAFSRAIERRADRFALELTGDGEAYAAALERLGTEGLADPGPPRLAVFFLYSHPPIAERVRKAREFAKGRTRS